MCEAAWTCHRYAAVAAAIAAAAALSAACGQTGGNSDWHLIKSSNPARLGRCFVFAPLPPNSLEDGI